MAVNTTPAALTVAAGNAPTAIDISAPSDPDDSAAQLSVLVTGLPSDGTVYLADGVTPLISGEEISVAQLTGLTFAASVDAAGESAQFTYTVSDLAGESGTGTAKLSAVANTSGPQTSPAALTVAENASPAAIGITAPTDPNYAPGSLGVSVLGLPTDGTVTLADGETAVTVGETLTVAQLTGLEFAPTANTVAENSQFSYSVGDPAGNSSLGTASLSVAPAAGSTILTVGPGEEYSTIAAAIAASQNGDTIQVQAGTYVNDLATINDNITLEGIGGMVNMVATGTALADANDKGILVTNGNDTINNFSFSGAQADPSSDNGAGIRYQLGNLVLNHDYFFNNQDGLLGGSGGVGTITINNSEFADNGVSNPALTAGYGYTHNLYVGDVESLTVDDSFFYSSNVGHEIKSRAENTTIENSVIEDGPIGTGSYAIDLPNGGNALIENNLIEKGPLSENPIVISFGEEGGVYPGSSLQVIGNTILDDQSSSSSLGVKNTTNVTAQITGNSFFGLTAGQIAAGPNTQSDNIFLASEPALITTQPWATGGGFEIACYCRGTRIMTAEGEVAVEDLAIGDRVLTESGWLRPVKWIGRRGYGGRFVAGNRDVLPVVIRAGALAEGVPSRDLWVSPEHAMLLDGVLVPARLLLNGATITQADAVERVEYFHIELAAHDVILAEGAAAESFVDCDSRGMFHNAGEYAALYPGDAGPGWRFCAPRVEAASAALAAIRARLGARAGVGAAARDGMAGNIELFDGRRIEGWAFDPAHPQARVRLEVLCDGELVGHVVAERYRADLEAAGKGDGRCSFAFALPVGLDPLSRHRVELRRASDGAAVPGSPVSVPAAAPFDAAARQAASGLLARVMPEEIDGTVGYLVGQTERLLAARARLDGGSRGAVADLRSRWGGLVPSRALREAAPALQPRALFVDERFPAERAGADAALAPMRALQGLGFVVSFVAARDPAGGAGGAEFLAARGIKALTAPWYGSVEEALRSHAGGLDLVYLHQASNAAAYGELVRHYCPQAQLVYGVSARHRPGRTCDQLAAAATADAVIVPSRAEAALLRAALAGVAVRIVPWPAPSAPNLAAAGEARIDAAMRDIVRSVLRRWSGLLDDGPLVLRDPLSVEAAPGRKRARG